MLGKQGINAPLGLFRRDQFHPALHHLFGTKINLHIPFGLR